MLRPPQPHIPTTTRDLTRPHKDLSVPHFSKRWLFSNLYKRTKTLYFTHPSILVSLALVPVCHTKIYHHSSLRISLHLNGNMNTSCHLNDVRNSESKEHLSNLRDLTSLLAGSIVFVTHTLICISLIFQNLRFRP